MYVLFALEHGLLALHQLQAHVGGPEVTRYTDEVGFLGTVAVDHLVLVGFPDAGDGDGQSCDGRGGIASHEVHVMLFAGQAQAVVEVL